MNTYPGNPSLPAEVRERVLSTFRQTLDLYKQGQQDEASAGCELLLKIDGQFSPAKKLMQKMNDPSADINVDTLLAASAVDRLEEATRALSSRDFQFAMTVADAVLVDEPLNERARAISDEASERIEAEPFIRQFASKARTQIEAGDLAGAQATMEKTRVLDPTHPLVLEIESQLGIGGGAAPEPEAFSFEPASSSFDFRSAAAAPPPREEAGSFIVDAQPSAPAPAAPSDFGFTFEEERNAFDFGPAAGATSSDTAFGDGLAASAMPTIAGEAQTFDFSTAPVEVSDNDQNRIARFLADGDGEFAKENYAEAIDIWSRIFLIDVTNEEASAKIENAREKRATIERQADVFVSEGIAAFDAGDQVGAREKLQRALQLDPTNIDAVTYLERIATTTVESVAPSAPASRMIQPVEDLYDDLAMPPSPGGDPAPRMPARSGASRRPAGAEGKAKSKSRLPVAAVAVVALLIVAAGGWFAWSKFGNRATEYDAAKTAATFATAQSLARTGKLDEAIAALLTVKADDPEHNRALEMIVDLKSKKASGGLIDGRPADDVFQELVQEGRASIATHDYLKAKGALERASTIRPLPADVKSLYENATAQVAQLQSGLNLFKEGNYRGAIDSIQPILAQNPNHQNAKQIVANAHFNLGAQALQAQRFKEALAEFDEVLAVSPTDTLAKRSRDLAARYQDQPETDLLYSVYVKYLPLRTMS